jgi:membrane protein implicated in regulation of membrane protease activity
MELTWLLIIGVLAVIEAMTVNLVTIWFIASALVSLVLSFFNVKPIIQVAVFVILGVALLVTTRKPLQNLVNKTKTRTNADRILDMEGIVTEDITPTKSGEVKVDGKRWTAIADKEIKKGSTVKILKIEGVKLIVEEV